MRGSALVIQPPEEAPANVPSKTLTCYPDSHRHSGRTLQTRGRIRKPGFPLKIGIRRVDGPASSGRRSFPATPMIRWNLECAERSGKLTPEVGDRTFRKGKNALGRTVETLSARKIAAGIWHLQLKEVTLREGGGREATGANLGFEHCHGSLQFDHACDNDNGNLHFGLRNGLSTSVTLPKSASTTLPNPAMEKATKWDFDCQGISEEAFHRFSQLKFLENKQASTASVVSSLQAKLELARTRIYELEAERQSYKKKMDNFLRKLAEERALWRTREHEKVRSIISGMKDDLRREKKNRQRVEIVNSKLVNELAEAKLTAKRIMQEYDKEKKARELMEEVCDELAKEIGEDKAEVDASKRESIKIREEVEEERKMLQMAEVWREERVQMKLLDAKLALEDKHSKLCKLQEDIEAFLRAQKCSSPDTSTIRQAELLKEAVDLIKMDDIKEFAYQPPAASEDIFAVFEELKQKEETKVREIEPCYGNSPNSHESNIHSVSPATDVFLEKSSRRYSNADTGDDSDWETLSPGEEHESSNSPGISEPSVNAMCDESFASASEMDKEKIGEKGEVNIENREKHHNEQGRKTGATITTLWKSSCPHNGEIQKKSAELLNGKLLDGRMSNVTLYPECKVGEDLSPPRIDRWNSPDLANRHLSRGMKGCIEWPRGLQKHSLKAKLLEARLESQKTQLRHVLKHKI
ncbi:hypothetical protein HPP92_016529 [Vanilla planifolia]|uniref:Uncharacterized protein n=1 Tax=Vanilla planifolia TaxID=51239 RepID=A0A835QHQ4_VANPL|nr:hypothetical protein HPP92_016529 [Vanilla planifolia]